MEGSDGAASRDAQSENVIAGGRDEAVTVPSLLDDPHTRLCSQDHQHPGTHVALPWQISISIDPRLPS